MKKVRGYHATEVYRKAMRKRKVWVEPLFAEANEWHGLRRLRLRGLGNANIQGSLIAAGQNLKRLVATIRWAGILPRRQPPSLRGAGSRRLPVTTEAARDRGAGEREPERTVRATLTTGGMCQRPGLSNDGLLALTAPR